MTFKKFNEVMMEIGFPTYYPIDHAWIKEGGGCVAFFCLDTDDRYRIKSGEFMFIEATYGTFFGPKPETPEQLKTLFKILKVF